MKPMDNHYRRIFSSVRDRVQVTDAGMLIPGREPLTYKDPWAASITTRRARGLTGESPYHIHIGVREADLPHLALTANPFTGEILPFIVQNDSWTEWGEPRTDDVHHVLIEAEQLESAIEYVSVMMRDILVPWNYDNAPYNPQGQIAVTTDAEDWSIKYEEGSLFAWA